MIGTMQGVWPGCALMAGTAWRLLKNLWPTGKRGTGIAGLKRPVAYRASLQTRLCHVSQYASVGCWANRTMRSSERSQVVDRGGLRLVLI